MPSAPEPALQAVILVTGTFLGPMAEKAFRGAGFVAQSADSMRRGMELLDGAAPDVLLVDVELADGSGLVFADAVKSDPAFSDCAVVLITPARDASLREQLERTRADGHLQKPFSAKELAAWIEASRPNLGRRQGDPGTRGGGGLVRGLASRYAALKRRFARKPMSSKVVLVIESDDELRGAILKRLSAYTLDVHAIANPRNAAIFLKKRWVDLVFLQLEQDEVDGAAFCRALVTSRLEGDAAPQVVLLSDGDETAVREVAAGAGASSYVIKPFSAKDLERWLEANAPTLLGSPLLKRSQALPDPPSALPIAPPAPGASPAPGTSPAAPPAQAPPPPVAAAAAPPPPAPPSAPPAAPGAGFFFAEAPPPPPRHVGVDVGPQGTGTPPRDSVYGGTPPRDPVYGGAPPRDPVYGGAPSRDPVYGGAPPRDPVYGGAPSRDPVYGGAPSRDPVYGGGAAEQHGPPTDRPIPADALAKLERYLRHEDPGVRAGACHHLASFGSSGGVPLLVGALEDDDEDVFVAAVVALGELGPLAFVAVGPLLPYLQLPQGWIVAKVTETLGRIGHGACVPALVETLARPEPEVAAAGAKALGMIGDDRAIPALEAALARGDERISANVTWALRVIDRMGT